MRWHLGLASPGRRETIRGDEEKATIYAEVSNEETTSSVWTNEDRMVGRQRRWRRLVQRYVHGETMMGGLDDLFLTTWGVVPAIIFGVILLALSWWDRKG